MAKIKWKAGNMIYPLPAVMVSCGATPKQYNIITIAWTGTICTNPPMTYISVRPTRHSYALLKEAGGFVINLTTESLIKATDYAGVRSGAKENKFETLGLTPVQAHHVLAPMILESPVSIECEITEIKALGSHDMFLAKVLAVHVDEKYLDVVGKFHLNNAKLITYSHGTYFGLGQQLGTFGYSVKKNKPARAPKAKYTKG